MYCCRLGGRLRPRRYASFLNPRHQSDRPGFEVSRHDRKMFKQLQLQYEVDRIAVALVGLALAHVSKQIGPV